MAEDPIDKRAFTDQEVREILRRAVETEPPDALSSGQGFSLAELKSIGAEAGIDPARLEEAARAVAHQVGSAPMSLVGIPTPLRFRRRVEGELSSPQTAEVLAIVRHIFGIGGEVSEVGTSLEWRAHGEGKERLVTVSSADGYTTIEAMANLTQKAVGAYTSGGVIAIVLSIIGIVISVDQPTLSIDGLLLSLGLLPAAYLILRSALRRIATSESGKLEQVVEQLAQLTGSAGDRRADSERG